MIPTTGREKAQQALQVTGWMLQAIQAPKDLQYWPRRDREAWMDVVGRPRLREVMARLQGANLSTMSVDEAEVQP